MKTLVATILLALLLAGCSEKQPEGVYVDITLENRENLNSYVLFNPNIKTIEECEASMEGALPSIMAAAPKGVPKDSKATGWKCYLTDPRKGKNNKSS